MDELVNRLILLNKSISTMESATGGFLASCITDIPGASQIFRFGAVTYSNDFKIKMGVSSDIIDKYSVYSMNVARDMAFNISNFTGSSFGIGITGKINREDINNPYGDNNRVFCSIFDSCNNVYYDLEFITIYDDRHDNKVYIINQIVSKMLEIL